MRLAKFLAHSGVASRRASEALVAAGRVTVGEEVVTDPARDVDESSAVAIDGETVSPEATEVWAVHKPVGVVSTASEPGERRAVVELVDSDARLYPVGRLDADSSGLLLLTNDGALANRLTHPRYEVPKTYRMRLAQSPREADLGLSIYGRLFDLAEELEHIGSAPLFQYILTTTTPPPTEFRNEPYLRLKLEGDPPAQRLLGVDL